MDTKLIPILTKRAQNYHICLADLPPNLKPTHLQVPADQQNITFTGLHSLHTLIGVIYDHFSRLVPTSGRLPNEEYCYRVIEAPVKLLWALGMAGKLILTKDWWELQVSKEDLDAVLKRCGAKDASGAFEALELVGFQATYLDSQGIACSGGYKKSNLIVVKYKVNQSAENEALLRALVYIAPRLPTNKNTKKSFIVELFLRADFRFLLPGYRIRMPHFPTDEAEVTRTFDPNTLAIWREITTFMSNHHPDYRLYFRIPRPRGRGWVADYSLKDNDYGSISFFIDENGLSLRIVFSGDKVPQLLDHVSELSPDFQEIYLHDVRCKDCVRCGKHIFYPHGDHVHRLCKSPWFASPFLKTEDLPDIERLIDWRLAN
jgi:hypothetical protein